MTTTTPASNALIIVKNVIYQQGLKSALSVKKDMCPLNLDVKLVEEEAARYVLRLIHRAVLNAKKDFMQIPIKSVKFVLSNVAHVRTTKNVWNMRMGRLKSMEWL